MNETVTPYSEMEDSHGATASVYLMDNLVHEVHYKDKSGKKFFTEKFEMIPIEVVEKMANDWAIGNRKLSV